jgi:hypothetical protein
LNALAAKFAAGVFFAFLLAAENHFFLFTCHVIFPILGYCHCPARSSQLNSHLLTAL